MKELHAPKVTQPSCLCVYHKHTVKLFCLSAFRMNGSGRSFLCLPQDRKKFFLVSENLGKEIILPHRKMRCTSRVGKGGQRNIKL